jgi:hypothetical protein
MCVSLCPILSLIWVERFCCATTMIQTVICHRGLLQPSVFHSVSQVRHSTRFQIRDMWTILYWMSHFMAELYFLNVHQNDAVLHLSSLYKIHSLHTFLSFGFSQKIAPVYIADKSDSVTQGRHKFSKRLFQTILAYLPYHDCDSKCMYCEYHRWYKLNRID